MTSDIEEGADISGTDPGGGAGPDEEPGGKPDEGPNEGPDEESASDESDGARPFWKEFAVLAVIGLALALVVQTWVVQPFYVPSGSMENTLLVGDRVFADKLFYRMNGLERGDVIVFSGETSWDEPPGPDRWEPSDLVPAGGILGFFSGKDYTKRLIGLPGDTVECCDERNRLLVNGEALDEPYLYPGSRRTHEEFGPVTVDEGRLWVMGDHREISYDSRGHQGDPGGDGTIPVSAVIGRAFMIHWPLDRITMLSGH